MLLCLLHDMPQMLEQMEKARPKTGAPGYFFSVVCGIATTAALVTLAMASSVMAQHRYYVLGILVCVTAMVMRCRRTVDGEQYC